jgi:two-component system NtrC family response regulator
MKHILVVDDEAAHRLMIHAVMEDAGWTVSEASSAEEALASLSGGNSADIRVILLDVRLPGMSGPELLATLRREHPDLPVVMLTAFGTVGSAVEAMKKGAFDYLTKPADNDELLTVAAKALDQSTLLRENERLREKLAGNDPLAPLVGDGAAMRRVKEFIRQAGPSEGTVLVLGESGTGKELIADALHAFSPRAKNPLVKVNCAALPENLLESELFGFQKGAFTGAAKDKPGRFQLAHGGTLFLDEVGEMPVDLQSKLLRAIQERVVEPLGSVRPVPVDVRIIAAANRDLQQSVRDGGFREDLFFRLNVLEVTAPPLRDRREDIPVLAGTLLRRLCEKNRKNVRGITPEMLEALTGHAWPGNVRELENVLERAVILGRSDMLGVESLPQHFLHTLPSAVPRDVPRDIRRDVRPAPSSGREEERQTLIRALEGNGGHRERTAEALGVSRRTLQYKLRKHGLARRG